MQTEPSKLLRSFRLFGQCMEDCRSAGILLQRASYFGEQFRKERPDLAEALVGFLDTIEMALVPLLDSPDDFKREAKKGLDFIMDDFEPHLPAIKKEQEKENQMIQMLNMGTDEGFTRA